VATLPSADPLADFTKWTIEGQQKSDAPMLGRREADQSLLSIPPSSRADLDATRVTQLARGLDTESRRRASRLRHGLACADTIAFGAAAALTVGLGGHDALNPIGLLLFPTLIGAAKVLGLYDSDDQRIHKTTAEELPKLMQLGALLVLALWLGDRLLIGGPVGKTHAIAIGVMFVTGALIGRRKARRLANRDAERERCLFVGDEAAYRRLATIFKRHELASDLIGRAAVEQVLDAVGLSPRDEVTALRELIVCERAHRIIIGPHGMTNATTFELVEAARLAGARVSIVPDMLEVVGSSVDFDDLYGVTLLGVRHSQLSRSSKLIKRGFDVVGAAVLLILMAPLAAIIAAAIRLDSKGPVLFRQARIGRGGQAFHIIKFRTMVPDAEALKERLRELNEAEGLFKIADDPRVTRFGRLLRRTSLDELPQLLNVLCGSMSLVGPRPLVADEDGRILGVRRGRLRLTPGMTGPWQVSGSARVPLEDMVKLDHLYVSNWSLWADAKILLRTVPCVFGARGL
jgi:exopolysaccharide biosynthesis polyprenyl glycosylphosphotransferase